MHQQFNIQQLYALPTLYLCILYLSEKKQRLGQHNVVVVARKFHENYSGDGSVFLGGQTGRQTDGHEKATPLFSNHFLNAQEREAIYFQNYSCESVYP
jgi:hypothetical protein